MEIHFPGLDAPQSVFDRFRQFGGKFDAALPACAPRLIRISVDLPVHFSRGAEAPLAAPETLLQQALSVRYLAERESRGVLQNDPEQAGGDTRERTELHLQVHGMLLAAYACLVSPLPLLERTEHFAKMRDLIRTLGRLTISHASVVPVIDPAAEADEIGSLLGLSREITHMLGEVASLPGTETPVDLAGDLGTVQCAFAGVPHASVDAGEHECSNTRVTITINGETADMPPGIAPGGDFLRSALQCLRVIGHLTNNARHTISHLRNRDVSDELRRIRAMVLATCPSIEATSPAIAFKLDAEVHAFAGPIEAGDSLFISKVGPHAVKWHQVYSWQGQPSSLEAGACILDTQLPCAQANFEQAVVSQLSIAPAMHGDYAEFAIHPPELHSTLAGIAAGAKNHVDQCNAVRSYSVQEIAGEAALVQLKTSAPRGSAIIRTDNPLDVPASITYVTIARRFLICTLVAGTALQFSNGQVTFNIDLAHPAQIRPLLAGPQELRRLRAEVQNLCTLEDYAGRTFHLLNPSAHGALVQEFSDYMRRDTSGVGAEQAHYDLFLKRNHVRGIPVHAQETCLTAHGVVRADCNFERGSDLQHVIDVAKWKVQLVRECHNNMNEMSELL